MDLQEQHLACSNNILIEHTWQHPKPITKNEFLLRTKHKQDKSGVVASPSGPSLDLTQLTKPARQ